MDLEEVRFRLPRGRLQQLDELVRKGIYVSREEALQEAVYILVFTWFIREETT